MDQHSYSRIRAYMECPRMAKFRADKVPQNTLPEVLVIGKAQHKFFERLANHCLAHDTYQVGADVGAVLADAYNEHVSEARTEPVLSMEKWIELTPNLRRWAEQNIIPIETVVGVEDRLSVDRDMNPAPWDEGWFRGVLDLHEVLEGNVHKVTDYKTMYSGKSDEQQALVYAWMIMGADPAVPCVEVVFMHTMLRDMEQKVVHTRDEWPEMDRVVRSMTTAIEADTEMRPRPGVACETCAYRWCCDAKVDIPGSITTEDDARKAVEALCLLEADTKALKECLRVWCSGNGPVTHNGITWGFHQSMGEGFHDVAEFVSTLKAAGEEVLPYLKVDNVKAKKLRRRFESLLSEKPRVVFAGRKAGQEDE
jgi:CRISPR/Cas system-associated exonuclease Cas4 (RecB family)